jgi:hypothetical protein
VCLLRGTFCTHSVFVCLVWMWEQTAIISLYSINWLLFITETECVYSAVRRKPLQSLFVCYVRTASNAHTRLSMICNSKDYIYRNHEFFFSIQQTQSTGPHVQPHVSARKYFILCRHFLNSFIHGYFNQSKYVVKQGTCARDTYSLKYRSASAQSIKHRQTAFHSF